MNFFKIAVFCLFMGLADALAAQLYAVGNVFDSESGEPISYVVVYTRSGKKLGTSNSQGRFEIEIESPKTILVFKRHGFRDVELDLGAWGDLIDLEVAMESEALRLRGKEVTQTRKRSYTKKTKSVEEMEQFQGMRIDLNDHLRQLDGVSGMEEYSSKISVYGSRTEDVTHYLGQTQIPSIRHLDFGFPGNQSVLNPRLLKSVTVEDNLSQGPLNQGNASALRYEIAPGHPEKITGDLVFGTFNREANFSGYWDNRTWVGSVRFLQPSFLANLGSKYFTIPKEARLGKPCPRNVTCRTLENPIDVNSTDLFFGTMYNDSTGYSSKTSFLFVGDDFKVTEDISNDFSQSQAQTVQSGEQQWVLGAYEMINPGKNADFMFSLGALTGSKENEMYDTSLTEITTNRVYPTGSNNLMGFTQASEGKLFTSLYRNPREEVMGADIEYGTELSYNWESRKFIDETANLGPETKTSYLEQNLLLRAGWNLKNKKSLKATLGFQWADYKIPMPVASVRLNSPLPLSLNGFVDVSLRQNTQVAAKGTNNIEPVTTPSVEAKTGYTGEWGPFTWSHSLYSRYYLNPLLPEPEVYWNYKELNETDYAWVNGTNLNMAWEPSHHFGINFNGSIVQGDYVMDNGSYLPWEANRSLDFVSNMRIVPRRDSLLSVILTYVVNNGVPLYDYILPRETIQLDGRTPTVDTWERKAVQSEKYPEVSRQRVDVRINLDLRSKWRPLDKARLFFQASNIFADMNQDYVSFLGGENTKQRGWTRFDRTNPDNLTPVVIRGLGLFILLGFEMNFSI